MVGAALALAHLDVIIDMVAAFRLYAEHLVAVGSYLFQRCFTAVYTAHLADAIDKFHEVGRLARPPHGRGIGRHQDIDLFVEETQAARFIRALHQQGFKERTEAYSTPQHIVFADADGRTVDLHLFTYTSDGEIVFEGETYPADTFSGEGCIGEKKVSCIPPQAQVAFHTGYVFYENDVKDVLALCYRFHIPVPNEYLPYIN